MKKPNPHHCFSVGDYALDMMLAESPALREFSRVEYEVMPRQFQGEKIYHGPDVDFIGRPWNLTLGVVRGKLYKIALYLELREKTEANEAAFGALTYCNEQLGRPSEQRTGLFVWDTIDGNVILQTAEAEDGFGVNVFLTSRSVQQF